MSVREKENIMHVSSCLLLDFFLRLHLLLFVYLLCDRRKSLYTIQNNN